METSRTEQLSLDPERYRVVVVGATIVAVLRDELNPSALGIDGKDA